MKFFRIPAALFAAAMLLSVLLTGAVSAATEETEAGQPIISSSFDPVAAVGREYGNAPYSHGQHQTRIVSTDTGVYMVILTGNSDSDDFHSNIYNFSVIRVTPEGETQLLYEDKVYGTSTTAVIMADADGNIWIYSGWTTPNFLISLNVWCYDVSTGEITLYNDCQKVKGGGGYSAATIDGKVGHIYAFLSGDLYFSWCEFDIETKQWQKAQSVKTGTRYCYHFAYGDGKGGFYVVNERDVSTMGVQSNIDGLRVSDALSTYRSRKIDAGFLWDEGHLIHVPDANKNEMDCRIIMPVIFDVENGCYPNWTNVKNDLILDEETGLLYVLVNYDDNVEPGIVDHIFVYDTQNDLALVSHQEISFLQGQNAAYYHRFFTDTAGNLWLIVLNDADAHCEIWRGCGEHKDDFRLVYDGELPGLDMGGTFLLTSSRGGSTPSDVTYCISYYCSSYRFFSIDFAALRAFAGIAG